MPTWLQITLPIVTAALGFGLGRLGSALDRRRDRRDAESSRAPAFTIETYRGSRYRLINSGTARATGIDFGFEGKPLSRLPDNRDLDPGQSELFMVGGSGQTPKPHQVYITCNELPTAQVVPVPPKIV